MDMCLCLSISQPLLTFDDVLRRCEEITQKHLETLQEIKSCPELWLRVLACRVCGKPFAEEYPFSEQHGGGPACLYLVSMQNLNSWSAAYKPLTPALRQNEMDADFFRILGAEVGPEKCAIDNCFKLHIQNSILCRNHHFEMIMHRPSPAS